MNNIINYMYNNLDNKEKVVANFVEGDEEIIISNLRVDEIIRFTNYLNNFTGTNNFTSKVGIFLYNSLAFVSSFYAIELNGNIVVGINPNVTLEELNHIIDTNKIEIIITNDDLIDFLKRSTIKKIINYDEVNLNNYSNELKLERLSPSLEQTMLISYTSGTSGAFSKPVETTFKNVSFVSEEYKKIYNINELSNCITVLPMWHNFAMFACLTSSIVGNSKISIMKEWNLKIFLKLNEILKPDIFPGSPYMYIDINNNEEILHKLENLRICDSGGDSLPIQSIKKFESITGAIITEGYGLTETTSLTHFNYSAAERKIGSLGKCVSNTACKILDLNGNELNNNEWGLLWIKGPMVFKGYVGKKLDDIDNLTKDGWFNTNDVVKRDENGYYYFAGRYTDLKMLGDEDYKFRELENQLYKFEGLKRVHIKVNKNKVGNFPYFDIIAELKKNYTIQDLYDFINLNLKEYVINKVTTVDKLPTTGTGKIKRNKINDILEDLKNN